jgi:hypothetical protein
MNSKTLLSLATIVAATFALSSQAQTNNIYWDFTSASPVSTPITGLTTPTISQGNNHGTTTLISTTSASTAYTTSAGFSNSATDNAGAAAFTGVLNTGTSTYFATSLTLGPSAGASLTLTDVSFGSRSTGTGPTTFSLYDSTDNFATVFNLVATTTEPANSVWAADDFGSLAITLPDDGSTLSFRIYGSGGTGSAAANTANWRIDDLALSVPEPSTFALVGLGLGASGLFFIRRRK